VSFSSHLSQNKVSLNTIEILRAELQDDQPY